mmetsp:Transcript_17224/g.39709  ORF Transcript_17224/g.39709 Transcript_17224/m.39709 type:complete len:255 (-) Transcript_17224:2188-2952(-)
MANTASVMSEPVIWVDVKGRGSTRGLTARESVAAPRRSMICTSSFTSKFFSCRPCGRVMYTLGFRMRSPSGWGPVPTWGSARYKKLSGMCSSSQNMAKQPKKSCTAWPSMGETKKVPEEGGSFTATVIRANPCRPCSSCAESSKRYEAPLVNCLRLMVLNSVCRSRYRSSEWPPRKSRSRGRSGLTPSQAAATTPLPPPPAPSARPCAPSSSAPQSANAASESAEPPPSRRSRRLATPGSGEAVTAKASPSICE